MDKWNCLSMSSAYFPLHRMPATKKSPALSAHRLALAGVIALIAACRSGEPPGSKEMAWEDLPSPSWRIVARRDGKILLAANRVILRGIRRRNDAGSRDGADRAQEYPTLIFENGRVREGPTAHADVRVLAGTTPRDTLHLYSTQFERRRVLFAQTGEVRTPPKESPVEPGLYVIEDADRLWLLADSGAIQLTADTVAGIARDTLRSQVREGVRHLYWATGSLWKPDGSAIAYVTNRTWMLARGGGQEVWLVELGSRRERPLLSERGEFYSSVGWLGSELVFVGRARGILGVNPQSGRRRRIAEGAAVAFSPRGSRLLYMTLAGDTVRCHILTERGVVAIPHPPPGERFIYGGVFSPKGDRLILETTFARDSGITRALYVFELATQRMTPLTSWSFRERNRHPHGFPAWLDDSTLLLTQFDRVTGLESSTIVRLPLASKRDEP
jgi:hypothetical protein